jgi:hypothetical protein
MYQEFLDIQIAAAESGLALGYSLQELRANTGIIGELTAAIEVNGTLATANNQRGWDIEADGVKISVKTLTTKSPAMKVKASTAHLFEILRIYHIRATDGRLQIKFICEASQAEVIASPLRRDNGSDCYFFKMPNGYHNIEPVSAREPKSLTSLRTFPPGTIGARVWEIADGITARKGDWATTKEVVIECEKEGIISGTAGMYHWRKFHGLVRAR